MSLAKSGLHVYVNQSDINNSSPDSEEGGEEHQDLTEQYLNLDIPERQGLLPPLPDIEEDSVNKNNNNNHNNNSYTVGSNGLNSAVFYDDNNSSYHSRTQSLERVISSTPGSIHRSRASSNKVTTPTGMMTPKALDYSTMEAQTPANTVTRSESGIITPIHEKSKLLEEEFNALECSPTITIDERFDVSVDIPNEKQLPKTTEEKIKFFELFQRKEQQEFDKTLSSLKQGGWLSSKDLTSLETKKRNHFKKWEIKIKELKSSLRFKKQQYDQDFNGYFSPKDKMDFDSGFEGSKSPNLQTLEQQFSVLGISR